MDATKGEIFFLGSIDAGKIPLDWSLGEKEESKGTGPHLKDDPSSSHVLVVDEFHGVVSLLCGVGAEPFGETRQGNVVTIKVGCLKGRVCAGCLAQK